MRHPPVDGSFVRASPVARAAWAGEDLVVLHLDRGTYYTLNVTGAFLWNRIATGATLGELRDALVEHFDVERAEAWRDLVALVDDLLDEGLLQIEPTGGSGPSRPRT